MSGERRYSLARYSLNGEDKTAPVAECFSESMGAVAGAAVPVDVQERFGETVQGCARGTVSIACAFPTRESLGALVRMSADVLAREAFGGDLRGAVYGQKNLPLTMEADVGLGGALWASKDIPTALEAAERMGAAAEGSKKITAALSGFEVLTALLSATVRTTQQAVFQVTIPPGGELRIDSGLFTALLDGQNALHTQSGDWIDVSRELMRINIECASGGGLEGQLIYTERYL